MDDRVRMPRDIDNDYSREAASRRREFIGSQTKVDLHHVGQYSFDPAVVKGNIENFIGVVQLPLGIAGPLTIHGQYAQGDFWVPLATSEGTLVASYNRGMRVVSECGRFRACCAFGALSAVALQLQSLSHKPSLKWLFYKPHLYLASCNLRL